LATDIDSDFFNEFSNEFNPLESENTHETFYNDYGRYLTEMSKTPALPNSESIDIFVRIDEIKNDIIGRMEETSAFASVGFQTQVAKIQNEVGEMIEEIKELKKQIIEGNLRLVVNEAKKRPNLISTSLSFLDLIQEGNLGLIKAVDRFNYKLGYRFGTYAVWWIYQSISRGVRDKAKIIKKPDHIENLINKFLAAQRELLENGLESSDENLIRICGLSIEDIKNARGAIATDRFENLDTQIFNKNENGTPNLEFIDNQQDSPQQEAEVHQARERILEVLNQKLSERQFQVIVLRFGIYDGKRRTLNEIGALFGVTRERIRQIETEALAKLRGSSSKKLLEGLL
jgi:RNA polymerase primary sigma factor